jgi:protein TonB
MKIILSLLLITSSFAGIAQINTVSKEKPKEEVYAVVEEVATYPGGPTEFNKFIQSNLKYPEKAIRDSIEGKCFLKFVITSEGNIRDIKILKGVTGCKECDQESVRVIKAMPKWIPAKINGKPVSSFYKVPIKFVMN